MFLVQAAVRHLKDKDCVHNFSTFSGVFLSSSLLIQKQVRCSCHVQKIISPAVAFILLTERSCQDGNVETDAENCLDAFFFFSIKNYFGPSCRLFTAIFLVLLFV